MSDQLVSIIVTTYNRKKYLKECIESILNQTYINFELIIVDNFSNYDIKFFLNSFNDFRIKLIQNNNSGKYVINRNLGIKSSQGNFVAFCDDDDQWAPTNLKIKMNFMIKDLTLGMITSQEEIIDEIGKKTGKLTHSWITDNHFVTFKNLFFKNVCSPSSVLIRKSCFDLVGYFDESKKKKNIEDIDYWLRFSLKFKILYLNQVLGYFRMHDSNESYVNDIQMLNSYYLRKDLVEKKNKQISVFYNLAKLHLIKIKLKIAFFYLTKKRLSDSLNWFIKLVKD